MARQDKGAGGATPMDWNEKVITLVGKNKDFYGNIYDYTIAVEKLQKTSNRTNVISVDMRNILP